MTTEDTNLNQLIIHELTKEQYEALTPEPNQLYLTPDTLDEDIAEAIAEVIPDQTGNSGKFLTTDGTDTSWESLPDVDQVYDATSTNAQSGTAVASAGFLTSITSSDVTNALGYTPYDSSNPSGYTSNTGTVTSVNNVSPVNGNVSLTIPSEVTETTVTNWGFTKNIGTVTSVNSVSPVDGNVTLSIPSEVTETTVSNWGFTKNTGTVTSVNNVSPVDGNVTMSTEDILPSQSGQSGKFLATNGTTTSWETALTNIATGSNSLTILGIGATANNSINIGATATSGTGATAIGYYSAANGARSVAIGTSARIGGSTTDAIQLGYGTNPTATTFYVGFYNQGNYQLLDGTTGLIPTDRLTVFTGADGTNAGTKGAVPQPSATDNTKFLKGDGTWETVDGLPSQSENSGKFLTTNGTTASWASITIPTVNNATLTIQKNGTQVQTFTANASSDVTCNITVPTDTNDLTNGAGFITLSSLSSYQLIAQPNTVITTTSGTIILSDNTINHVQITGDTTFSLPTISDTTKNHQILVQLTMNIVRTINLGTSYYFNKTAPDMSSAGIYNIYYEYDNIELEWVVGVLPKGSAS